MRHITAPWNPEKYDEFKSERFAPFYDLISLIDIKPAMDVIDLGIDSSVEMLSKAEASCTDTIP